MADTLWKLVGVCVLVSVWEGGDGVGGVSGGGWRRSDQSICDGGRWTSPAPPVSAVNHSNHVDYALHDRREIVFVLIARAPLCIYETVDVPT